MLTREQQYAARTFEQLFELAPQPEEKRKKYGSMAHKLPVLIRIAGLSQALHFLDSRGNDDQKLLLRHLALTLGFVDEDELKAEAQLLERSRASQLSAYMRLTQQAMSALQWYKRFAQSVLRVESGEE
jgi:CRISPR-associated protein Cmr5